MCVCIGAICRKKFEMQKLKIEQDFAEKAKLVQLELEREREKAKSEKEKYENEKAKLEHERKKLEQLKMEIREREERNATALNVNKLTDNCLIIDKSVNPDKDVNNTSTITHPTVSTNVHPSASSVNITSTPVNASHGLVTNNMAATVLGVSGNEQVSLELHESIHSLEQTPAITNTELLERERQLLLQKEKLDAMQAQLNGKLSGNNKAQDTSEILQFVTEKEKLEQQRILLERAKFSAESKER